MIRAVIDTNVLVSGLLKPAGNEALLILAVHQGLVRPCVSAEIMEECAEVLARPKFAFPPTEIAAVIGMLGRTGESFIPEGPAPGEHALSNAERQARYRARRETERPPPEVRYRRPADRRTRSQRWYDTVNGLVALQAEYVAWHDALPDSLRDSSTAEALQAIVDLDLDALVAIVPPRGYGRD